MGHGKRAEEGMIEQFRSAPNFAAHLDITLSICNRGPYLGDDLFRPGGREVLLCQETFYRLACSRIPAPQRLSTIL